MITQQEKIGKTIKDVLARNPGMKASKAADIVFGLYSEDIPALRTLKHPNWPGYEEVSTNGANGSNAK